MGEFATSHRLKPEDKEKIAFLRLFLVVLLVLLHFGSLYASGVDPRRGYFGQDHAFASIVVSFVLFLGFTAVPALSVISGYLFFAGTTPDIPPDFRGKWRRRLRSLVLPFLIWSGAFVLAAYFGSLTMGLYDQRFGSADNLGYAIANSWLGLTTYPVAIQLWFVRDLILTIALSPVIWLAVSRVPVLTLAALFGLWLADQNLWIFTRLDVVGFFTLGAAFAIHGWKRDLPKRYAAPLFATFLALVLLRTLLPAILGTSDETWGLYVMTCLMRVFGVITVWTAAPLLMGGAVNVMTARFSYLAFFIHCAHYPPIYAVKSIFGRALDPENSLGHLVVYVATSAVTIVAAVAAAQIIGAISPRVLSILSGGRTQPEIPSRRTVPISA
jgi:succinoglycan biosynthesis protein ExoH